MGGWVRFPRGAYDFSWEIGAAVARLAYTEKAGGSNPSSPTMSMDPYREAEPDRTKVKMRFNVIWLIASVILLGSLAGYYAWKAHKPSACRDTLWVMSGKDDAMQTCPLGSKASLDYFAQQNIIYGRCLCQEHK